MLGRPPTKEERAFFPVDDIDLCIHDFVEKENLPNSRIEAGVDWGESVGETVVTITERIYGRRKVLFIKRWRKVAVETQLPEIKELLDQWKPETVRCDSKPAFAVDLAKKLLKNLTPIDAQYHKTEMLAQLYRKVKTHGLEVPANQVDLIKQLRSYHLHKRAGDDLVDSLCLSIFETSTESTGHTNIIKRKKR